MASGNPVGLCCSLTLPLLLLLLLSFFGCCCQMHIHVAMVDTKLKSLLELGFKTYKGDIFCLTCSSKKIDSSSCNGVVGKTKCTDDMPKVRCQPCGVVTDDNWQWQGGG
jgi:hypothetical protein